MSWDRMRRKKEDPKSYEDERRNHGIGLNQKLKTEFLEIGSRNGSMTELIRISRNKVITTEFSGRGSRRVTGSYGRSIGIGELVDTSREHGRSAVSMETMDSYGFICEEGQAQPRRGPSSRSMQMVITQGLERQEPKESSPVEGGGAVYRRPASRSEEEEQCRRSRHSSGGTGVPSKQGSVRGRAPETQRWLGTISINTKVMMTPRSGVSVDDNEVNGVGDKVIPGPQWTTAFGSIVIQTADLLWAAFGRQFIWCVEWMRIHSTSDDKKSTLFVKYCTGVCKEAPPPYQTLSLLSYLSCVNFIDTAPLLHVPFAGVLYTALLPPTGDSSLLLLSCGPLSDNLATDLRGICHKVSLVADSGGICDIDDARADFAGVCHRADSTADLGELCRSSYDLPDSTIPVLPSYHFGLPSLCAA
ncbi:uncharacterized protein UDID_17096 [Ustilago sp. UG-2017a]|nr:uncharacterized protein UDID_17096 [Ustilago sp. UG-2017a]